MPSNSNSQSLPIQRIDVDEMRQRFNTGGFQDNVLKGEWTATILESRISTALTQETVEITSVMLSYRDKDGNEDGTRPSVSEARWLSRREWQTRSEAPRSRRRSLSTEERNLNPKPRNTACPTLDGSFVSVRAGTSATPAVRAVHFRPLPAARPIAPPIQYESPAFKSTPRVFADYFPVLVHNEKVGQYWSAVSKSAALGDGIYPPGGCDSPFLRLSKKEERATPYPLLLSILS